MTRIQLLGKGQERPRYCQACAQNGRQPRFFMNNGDYPVILEWLHDGQGRVLWYFYCCVTCYRKMPAWAKKLAVEPPADREPSAAHPWFGDLPVSPPPRRYAAAGRR